MELISEIAIKIFVESILISVMFGYFLSKREERVKKTIEEEFRKRDKFFDARFNFKMRALKEITHVFTYNFPQEAEKAFVEKYEQYRKELEVEGALS